MGSQVCILTLSVKRSLRSLISRILDDTPQAMADADAMLHLVSALLKYSGPSNVPVVDVHYDLSEVQSSIRDPSHFLRERWKLYQYVNPKTAPFGFLTLMTM